MQGFLKGVFFFIATLRLKTRREKSPVITVDLVYIKIYFWVYKTGHNKNPEGEGGLNGVQNNKKTKKKHVTHYFMESNCSKRVLYLK